ncbi:hypothetical protein ABBQ32_011811 [Trebouxia sp. C0010 RCD-2024]
MLWRLETSKQVAPFNEQKRTAYINLEYCYMQYCYGLRKGLNAKGLHSAFHYPDFREFGDMEEFAGRELWPAFLSKVSVEYQQPIYEMQKRFLSSVKTQSRIIKWGDQHAIKGKVKVHVARTGKRGAVATHTFVLGGDGLLLGVQQRVGNSIKETAIVRRGSVDRHKGPQGIAVAYTDNPRLFCTEWKEAHWDRSSRGKAFDVVPSAQVLVARLEAVLHKYMKLHGDDGTPIITEAVHTACCNQIHLARQNMLSDPANLDMYMAVQKQFKKKPSEVVVRSMRSTSQVEGFNAEMVQIWGSGSNMSPRLADFKLLELGCHWDLRILADIKGLSNPIVTDIGKLTAIRALRRDLGLPDKFLVPFEEDLPSLADAVPFGFEAMQLQLDPTQTEGLLEGFEDERSAEEKGEDDDHDNEQVGRGVSLAAPPMDLPQQASLLPTCTILKHNVCLLLLHYCLQCFVCTGDNIAAVGPARGLLRHPGWRRSESTTSVHQHSTGSGSLQQQAGGSIDLCSPDRTLHPALRAQPAGGLGVTALPMFQTAASGQVVGQQAGSLSAGWQPHQVWLDPLAATHLRLDSRLTAYQRGSAHQILLGSKTTVSLSSTEHIWWVVTGE